MFGGISEATATFRAGGIMERGDIIGPRALVVTAL